MPSSFRKQGRYTVCDLRTLSGRLRMARYVANVSWKQLAFRTGFSEHSVKKWELGQRSIPAAALPLIAKTAHVTVEWLVSGLGDPPRGFERFAHIRPDGTLHDLARALMPATGDWEPLGDSE
jgi:transcriptional regulator with XRE-family HTH domain